MLYVHTDTIHCSTVLGILTMRIKQLIRMQLEKIRIGTFKLLYHCIQ